MVFKNLDDTTPVSKMDLRVWNKTDFKLLTAFRYFPAGGSDPITVPAHDPLAEDDTTDLASVPSLLRGLLASYGRQLRAALVHDHLCKLANAVDDRAEAYRDRRRADQLFLLAMRDKGDETRVDLRKRVPWFRARLFWAGVGFGRYWSFRKGRAVLMTAQLLAGVAAIYASAHVLPHRWFAWAYPEGWGTDSVTYLLTFAAILALSALWGKDAGLVFVGMIVAPVIAPVLLLTLVAQTVLSLPDFAIKLSGMEEQPAAIVGPVVVQSHA